MFPELAPSPLAPSPLQYGYVKDSKQYLVRAGGLSCSVLGDVNGDGSFDATDADLVSCYAQGRTTCDFTPGSPAGQTPFTAVRVKGGARLTSSA